MKCDRCNEKEATKTVKVRDGKMNYCNNCYDIMAGVRYIKIRTNK